MVYAVQRIMVKKVVTCDVKDTIQSVARTMRKKKIGCLIVLKGKNPVGIVTERDVAWEGVANNLNCCIINVKEITSSPLKSISPDADIYYADAVMEKNNIKRLAVMKGKKLVGIITQSDMIKYFVKQRQALALDKFKKGIKSV